MNVADVLERAADIMTERGQAKYSYISPGGLDVAGSCCIKGALWLATHNNEKPDHWTAWDLPEWTHAAEAAVVRAERNYHVQNEQWSKDEAVAFLRACAAVERARAAVAEAIPIKVSA